jgi:hypothetical protein
MKTVKELRELIKDLPDDALIITRYVDEDDNYAYHNGAGMKLMSMKQKSNIDYADYTIDEADGKECLVIY